MWVEEISLENIKCFDKLAISFTNRKRPYSWITLLGENSSGKSTLLQCLALLLAGPEAAQQLCPRPMGWLANEAHPGKLSTRLHQGQNDPGQFGNERKTLAFGYTFHVTGSQPLTIRNKVYSEPSIQESPEKRLSWLRQNAFTSKGQGWFAVGYGAFRRLTRSSQVIVPTLEPQARFSNFLTQFNEDQPLSAFEQWLVYLDYRIVKADDSEAKRQKQLGIDAVNQLLPQPARFDSVTPEGRIIFDLKGRKVPTIGLSDGYRSVLALAGDLVWRLIQAFPDSASPLHEQGVVLIDELDIHLHPIWQRDIAFWLQQQFPHLQFIVATHSPLIASGAGEDALTLQFKLELGKTTTTPVENLSAMNVDRILESPAFGLVSSYSRQTAAKIDRYDELIRKDQQRTHDEEQELAQLQLFINEARPFARPPEPNSLEAKIENFLEKALSD